MATTPLTVIDSTQVSFADIGRLFVGKIYSEFPGVQWAGQHMKPWWPSSLQAESFSTHHVVLELILFVIILKLLLTPREKSALEREKLTDEEIDALIEEYEPAPLVSDIMNEEEKLMLQRPMVDGPATPLTKFDDGKERINMATYNFFDFIGKPDVEAVATDSIRRHGVGSCGPRGFYGTMDSHVALEERLADFMGTEEAILYSYGFSTIASALPAYAKCNDIVFCDEGVSFAVQKGLQASRSNLVWFQHNNMDDLQAKMELQEEEDKKEPAKAATIRRFLVVEGLYANYGDICPLPRLVELKYRYKVRIFIDESFSFGVLGATGRGVTEHYGVDRSQIDLICASVEYSLGTVGGFCAGTSFVVDHQRLSGLGYCFSASAPPYLADIAVLGLDKISANPDMIGELQEKARNFRKSLTGRCPSLTVNGVDVSPIIHLRLKDDTAPANEQSVKLQAIADKCWEAGLAVTRAKYIANKEVFYIQPSLRLTISLGHTDQMLADAARIIASACESTK